MGFISILSFSLPILTSFSTLMVLYHYVLLILALLTCDTTMASSSICQGQSRADVSPTTTKSSDDSLRSFHFKCLVVP